MGIARSTCYDRPERAADDTAIVEAILAVRDEFECYGYRRVGAAPRQRGLVVNAKKIRRLDRDDFGLNQSKIMTAIYFNSLERDFSGKPRTLFRIPL